MGQFTAKGIVFVVVVVVVVGSGDGCEVSEGTIDDKIKNCFSRLNCSRCQLLLAASQLPPARLAVE